MRRREFITLCGGVAAAWPLTAKAVGPAHVGFISSLDPSAAADFLVALRDGLAGYGYSEPGALKLDPLFADNLLEQVPALVEELERRHVNVIVTHAAATFSLVKGIEPNIRRIAIVANPLHPGSEFERKDSETKAQQLGMEISFLPTPNQEELNRALSAIEAGQLQAMVLFSDAFVVEHRKRFIEFAMRRGMPIISGWSVIADSGALCTYGPRLVESYRRVAYFVDRILKGAKPIELPIEQPTVLEFVVNLKTAKTLGITIPPTVLARADRVIE